MTLKEEMQKRVDWYAERMKDYEDILSKAEDRNSKEFHITARDQAICKGYIYGCQYAADLIGFELNCYGV